MNKIEVAKKNFEEFVNDVGIDNVEDVKFKMLLTVSTIAAALESMVKDEHKGEIEKLIVDFEEYAEHTGVIRFISQMLEDKGDSNE